LTTGTTSCPRSFVIGEKYVLSQDYHYEALPLVYDAKKDEVLEFQGRAVTRLQFQRTTQPYGAILIDKKLAFKILHPIAVGDKR